MRKYKIYDVMFNNYRCGNKCCYKEYVDMKYHKKNKINKICIILGCYTL